MYWKEWYKQTATQGNTYHPPGPGRPDVRFCENPAHVRAEGRLKLWKL
jgi:hypothetical protein